MTARLKAQDWLAITIELGIVILGVFIGTWVVALAVWRFGHIEERWTRDLGHHVAPAAARPS